MTIYCMGFEAPGHFLEEGALTYTKHGALCPACGGRYQKHQARAFLVATIRERWLYVIDADHIEPVRTTDPLHYRLAVGIARRSDPAKSVPLIKAHPDALELVLSDDGSASLWVADKLLNRISKDKRDDIAA